MLSYYDQEDIESDAGYTLLRRQGDLSKPGAILPRRHAVDDLAVAMQERIASYGTGDALGGAGRQAGHYQEQGRHTAGIAKQEFVVKSDTDVSSLRERRR